ncbi:MAG: hypothetical protein Q8M17_10130 [Actinomycetota bacterium]|nr:hypothetical protein [Actinomycetota bacterium]
MTMSRNPLSKAGDAGLHPSAERAEPSYLRRAATTADSVGAPDKDKLVDLGVRVPKSLRKSVRAEAERRGMRVDDVVAEALRERTPR